MTFIIAVTAQHNVKNVDVLSRRFSNNAEGMRFAEGVLEFYQHGYSGDWFTIVTRCYNLQESVVVRIKHFERGEDYTYNCVVNERTIVEQA
jgi:hypothetical protein